MITIKLNKSQYGRLFEGVYVDDLKNGKANLTYNRNSRRNVGNKIATDYLATDKMDTNNNDTYIVTLKGGLKSYNITSIKGNIVMHYFKRRWDNKKTTINVATSLDVNDKESKPKLEVLWVDDVRNPNLYFSKNSTTKSYVRNSEFYKKIFAKYNVDFHWVKNIDEFERFIMTNGLPDMCSFDFDLSDVREDGTHQKGSDCALWLKEYCKRNNMKLPPCYLHSANHGGREILKSVLDNVLDSNLENSSSEYELDMVDSEFESFKRQFISKVSNVVEYALKEMGVDEIEKLSIYPVQSSSNFNVKMCQEIASDNICGLPLNIVNKDILLKDLRNLAVDDDFIGKNKDFYNSKFVIGGSNNATATDYVETFVNKFAKINSTDQLLNNLNDCYQKLQNVINYNHTNIKKNGGLTEKQEQNLCRIYMNYYDSYALLKLKAHYFLDKVKNGFTKIQQGSDLLEPLKYSKGPSIDNRSNEVWGIVRNYVRGTKSEVTNKPYTQIDICQWQRPKFEIKSVTNATRMGVKNIYNPTTDTEMLNDELNRIGDSVLIVFDDNLSGGATLSDVCYQFKQLGIKHIIPITFGVMNKKETLGVLPLNKPINNDGVVGEFNY